LFSQALPPFAGTFSKLRRLACWCIYPSVVLALMIPKQFTAECAEILSGNENPIMLLNSMPYQLKKRE
jgi:hypothetical protein